ncbi:hypothetical protein MCHI_001686, partial [Candidatus Magnetoovum chiemensis]
MNEIGNIDKRKYGRDKACVPVVFSHSDFNDPLDRDAMVGSIINISDDGACIETIIRSKVQNSLEVGTHLFFLFKPQIKKKGAILWVEPTTSSKIHFGARFIEDKMMLTINPPHILVYKCPKCLNTILFDEGGKFPRENSTIECGSCREELVIKINKRGFYRRQVSLPVKFSPKDFDDINSPQAKSCKIIDISKSGIGIEMSKGIAAQLKLKRGARLTFITVLRKGTDPIKF